MQESRLLHEQRGRCVVLAHGHTRARAHTRVSRRRHCQPLGDVPRQEPDMRDRDTVDEAGRPRGKASVCPRSVRWPAAADTALKQKSWYAVLVGESGWADGEHFSMFVPRPWRALPPAPAPVLFPADLPASEEFTDGAGRTPSPGASTELRGCHFWQRRAPDTRKAKIIAPIIKIASSLQLIKKLLPSCPHRDLPL